LIIILMMMAIGPQERRRCSGAGGAGGRTRGDLNSGVQPHYERVRDERKERLDVEKWSWLILGIPKIFLMQKK
jgi:hypothetical protein